MVLSNRIPVLLDTNFVLSCYKFGISLDEIHDLVQKGHCIMVPQNVLTELATLKLRGVDKEAQHVMLSVLAHYPILPLEGPVDESLVDYAQKHECIICTNDKNLRKQVKSLGRKTIIVRSRSHLIAE